MAKRTEIPKSISADLNRVKARLATLEKDLSQLRKEYRTTNKNLSSSIKTQKLMMTTLGKRTSKKAKRKPSGYNLFLKGKMSSGMSMTDAVKAWKEREIESSGRTALPAASGGYGPGDGEPENDD